jgi:hypothetical protein
MARIEGFLQQSHGQNMMALSTVFDLIAEVYPAAAESLKVKLEERQAAAKAEMEAQQAASLKEADAALQAANDAEQERAMDELAESYNNVLKLPGPAIKDPIPGPNPDDYPEGPAPEPFTAPEVV